MDGFTDDVNGFWEGFQRKVVEKGVPEKNAKFYVRWAHQFAISIKGAPLRERSVADVKAWLRRLGDREDVLPWQVGQARDALRILYRDYLEIDPNTMRKETRRKPAEIRKDEVGNERLLMERYGGLLGQLRDEIVRRNYSQRTLESYSSWVRRFLSYCELAPVSEIGTAQIKDYLNYLALERKVAPSTQNQALNAIVFLFTQVLDEDPGDFSGFARAKGPGRVPTCLTLEEVNSLLRELEYPYTLMAALMFGSGLRLMEYLRLRIEHVDLERRQLTVKSGKGQKDRITILADNIRGPVRRQIEMAKRLFSDDRKYGHTQGEWFEQYVFPAPRLSVDPKTRKVVRGHFSKNTVHMHVRAAAKRAGISKRVSCHTLRHSFASHLVAQGCDMRTVQELLGHNQLTTTMRYTHPMNRHGEPAWSPAIKLSVEDVEFHASS